MIERIKTPHDSFFQSMMEDLQIAASFFQAHLDPRLTQAIDWSTLRIADAVRRSVKRKPLYTDITYHCLTHEPKEHVYLHVEQERKIDPFILERIFQYNAGLLLQHKKQGHQDLPLIISVVVYNGLKEEYPYKEDIYQYFGRPDLAKIVMAKPFILVNLNKESDEALADHGAGGFMELLLKRASRKDFLGWMKEHKELLRRIPASPYIGQGLYYALQVGESEVEEIIDTFVSIYPELKESVMTALRQLENRVRESTLRELESQVRATVLQEGIQQGMQQEKEEIAKNMLLQLGLDMDVVHKATGLSQKELEKLQKETSIN